MASQETKLLNDEAAAWFARLQNSAAPADDQRAFEVWIEADPARAVAYARVEATWERAERLTAIGHTSQKMARQADRQWMSRRAAAAALVTMGAVGVGVGIFARARGQRYTTAVGQRRTTSLSDGSRVMLNTDSEVTVAYRHDRRDLRLMRGEALFDVAKDSSRPFIVAAGDATVRAVGTQFNVRLKDRVAEVTVIEGVVSIGDKESVERVGAQVPEASHLRAGGGAVIAPGAMARLDLDADAVSTRLAWRQGMIELRGETLEQAVTEFNRYSARKLVIGDPKIASIRVGGEFGTDESEKFVEALKVGFNVRSVPGNGGDIYLMSAS
jgi:transmembrane sensor